MNVNHAIIVKKFEKEVNGRLKNNCSKATNKKALIYLMDKFQSFVLQKILSKKMMCNK
jgi:hypothetical protein